MKSTREAVREWRERDPDVTATELGEGLGVSRSRIGQILMELGLPTRTHRSYPSYNRGDWVQHKPRPRVLTGGAPVPISATVAGTIGELLAAADLMARGYTVYAPIARHVASADLIALPRSGGTPLRIEVRCGHMRKNGTVVFQKRYREDEKGSADHYAIIITGEPVVYKPGLLDLMTGDIVAGQGAA